MITSFFNLSPSELILRPDLAAKVPEWVSLERQCFGIPNVDNFLAWSSNWHESVLRDLKWCHDNGRRMVALADDTMDQPYMGKRLEKHGKQYVEYVAATLASFDICDGIVVVDEIKDDPEQYPAALFAEWVRSVCDIPIVHTTLAPRLWLNGKYCDKIGPQWAWWSCKVGADRLKRLQGSLTWKTPGLGLVAQLDVSGLYGKCDDNGKVKSVYPRKAPSALNIEKQVAVARKAGADWIRCWAWDCLAWQNNRSVVSPGEEVFVGIQPDDHRWERMIKALTPDAP